MKGLTKIYKELLGDGRKIRLEAKETFFHGLDGVRMLSYFHKQPETLCVPLICRLRQILISNLREAAFVPLADQQLPKMANRSKQKKRWFKKSG
ncbi:hypothetical protein BTA30_21160 [Bacillus swezeyi]|uniref:Uncharacterized protein n=1 Tax=Bacillus swezeyi TaxID=1925020 RepID=A0A1R1RGK8_9BACI|nr:hypothetical protein BW143_18755 [Bacillus swezeyi]OMI25168.1 hypothetical protein BTA30_21160 [Bacillus swezeyi]